MLTVILSLPVSAQSLSRIAAQAEVGTSPTYSSSGEFAAELSPKVINSADPAAPAEAGATSSTRSSLRGTITQMLEAQRRHNAAELMLHSYRGDLSNLHHADDGDAVDLLSSARDFLDRATSFDAGAYEFQVDVLQMRWLLRIRL